MQYPTDVPVHRPSVGAMGLSAAQTEFQFKPYVYRGTGVDRFPETSVPRLKPRKKRRSTSYLNNNLAVAGAAALEAQRVLDKMDRQDSKPKTKKKKPAKPRPAPARTQAPRRPFPPRRLAPAPGWTPLTGADVDELLSELEDVHEARDASPTQQVAWRDQAALLGVLHSDGGEYL